MKSFSFNDLGGLWFMNLTALEMAVFAPFLIQGLAMMFDEFYSHHKRGLPRWERIGHPLDTITVLSCFVFVLVADPSETNLWIYGGLCAFSCLFVTKDEPVHSQLCGGAESWLHSVLFVLHPLSFVAAGLIWAMERFENLKPLLLGQGLSVTIFLIYQIGYWNIYAKKHAH
ncbi:MAG: hypothetical protein IPK04_12305 [Bdellovibrionales bacterium]|nr:hypothetical protein [Bdellovibrionales bacterium]